MSGRRKEKRWWWVSLQEQPNQPASPTHLRLPQPPTNRRHPPGPAAPHLRRQAARGRPHALRLQHPEGVDAAPGAPPPRRHADLCQDPHGERMSSVCLCVLWVLWDCRGGVGRVETGFFPPIATGQTETGRGWPGRPKGKSESTQTQHTQTNNIAAACVCVCVESVLCVCQLRCFFPTRDGTVGPPRTR